MSQKKGSEIDIEQQITFLSKISFFNDFDEHELRQFLSVSKWLKVPIGTQIIKEGTSERVFYILVKGQVSVFKTLEDSGEPLELTRLSTGDCFGEMSLVMEVKRTAGVKTTRDSYILMVEPDIISTSNVFLQLKFYKRFCEILVQRLIMANKRMTDIENPSEEDEEARTTQAAREVKPPEPQPQPPQQPPPPKPKPAPAMAVENENIEPEYLPDMPHKEEKMGKTKIKRLINPDTSLAVNPAIAAQLSTFLATESTTNTRKYADLISLDPVISARILQVANSSFFRRSTAILSVPHAMITLGLEQIHKVVSETLEASHDATIFSDYSSLGKKFWRHSVVVARIADLLKDVIRLNIQTDVYLAGLLHDIGMLALDNLNPSFYPQLLRDDNTIGRDLIQAETEYIGIDHAPAGAWLGERMGLPVQYLKVLEFHHSPERAREQLLTVALINLADMFATIRGVCMGDPITEEINPLESYAWVLIQDQHKPFLDVDVMSFIESFNTELNNTWSSITSGIPL